MHAHSFKNSLDAPEQDAFYSPMEQTVWTFPDSFIFTEAQVIAIYSPAVISVILAYRILVVRRGIHKNKIVFHEKKNLDIVRNLAKSCQHTIFWLFAYGAVLTVVIIIS